MSIEAAELSDLELEYELHKAISQDVELCDPHTGNRFLIEKRYIRHHLIDFPNAKGDEPIDLGSVNYGYARSLDNVVKAEKIIIEKFGKQEYGKALIEILGINITQQTDVLLCDICKTATATPRQRATACLIAAKGKL